MGAVLVKAAAFVCVIAAGYLMKRAGLFRKEDFYVLSRVVIYVTLPAAIVSNFSRMTMEYSLLFMCVLGILCNLLTVGIGWLMNMKKGPAHQAFDMINMSGYNIGNFTMPFVQNFVGPVGFAVTSLFDAGNAVMCTGMTYTLASSVMDSGSRTSFKTAMKQLFSSTAFDAYIIMTVLSIMHIRLPDVVLSLAETAGGANAFVALFMTGIGFELNMDRENIAEILKVMGIRYGTALMLSLGFYFLLPFSLEVRQTMAIVSFGPVSSLATAYTGRLGLDVGLSSVINSLSIVFSVICMTAALIVVL